MRLSLAFVAATLLPACVGVPCPLAPSLAGSVGVPHFGAQTAAVELPPRGSGFQRFRPRGVNHWGLPRLVSLVEGAAAYVAEQAPGGAPLVVGDLSARSGGKIVGHNSHRSGRDVDLLLYLTTPAGASVTSPGFVAVDGDGLGFIDDSGEYVRLDVEREWLLVRYLVSSPETAVQFLFLSQKLEAILIDYALSRGEPLELVHRAQTVLMQPTDSTPHDDHVHMRIACTPAEAISGCSGGGPQWEWFPPNQAPVELADDELTQLAADDPLQAEGSPGGA
ncbi:MAG: penicillin-insensitive murein endopeptidase [Polyangiaceae bacterium]